MSMIFQNPRAALNPIRKVGVQIEDVLRQHSQTGASDSAEKAIEALEQVRISRARERYHAYPSLKRRSRPRSSPIPNIPIRAN